MPGNWDAEPQPFMGGLISEQAAQHVYDARQRLASLGDVRCWRQCLVKAGTSLLTPSNH